MSGRKIISLDEVKTRIEQIHGNRYSYPFLENEYTMMKNSLITVVCSIHGKFSVKIHSHVLLKTGCQKCGYNVTRHTQDKIIEDFKKIHKDYYDYSKIVYDESTNANSKVIIVCPNHGEFKQSVASHKRGKGCSSCASSNGGVSFKALTWLEYIATTENIHIQHAANSGEYNIPTTKYRVDGFCKETNTVYEFHGDLFHGNINRFDPSIQNNPFRTETVSELYKLTIDRENEIKALGHNLVTIWESDYDSLNIPLQRFDITTFKRTKSLEDLPTLMIKLLDDVFISTEYKHNWKCNICEKEFSRNLNKARIAFRESGRVGCSVECSNKSKGKSKTASEDRFFTLWDTANNKGFNLYRKNGNEYNGMNGKLSVLCKGCGNNIELRPVSIERAIRNRKAGCRICMGKSW